MKGKGTFEKDYEANPTVLLDYEQQQDARGSL